MMMRKTSDAFKALLNMKNIIRVKLSQVSILILITYALE